MNAPLPPPPLGVAGSVESSGEAASEGDRTESGRVWWRAACGELGASGSGDVKKELRDLVYVYVRMFVSA